MNENNGSSKGRWEFDQDGNVHYVPPSGDSSYEPSKKSTQKQTSSHSSKKSGSDWHWIVIVLAFMAAWPIGLVLLFLELSGKWPGSQQVEKEFSRAVKAAKNTVDEARKKQQTSQPAKKETTAQQKAAPPKKQTRQSRKKQEADEARSYGLGNVKLFHILGWSFTGIFGFAFIMTLVDSLSYFISVGYMLESLIPLACFTLMGIVFLMVAGSRSRKLKKFRKYKKLIGDKEEVSLSQLAKTLGISRKKVHSDIEEMLDRDVLPVGYVDASRDTLVLRDGIDDPPVETTARDISQADATLKHIRALNDAIANPELSRQIDHIEMLTAKIFRLLDERPEKSGDLRRFMNYYLPQTLKILENYAKLEAQGIEGGNIAEAKQKIEAMMDKLVDGYETQLDKLFADDVLDISADLKVMESMLAKDGLTIENDFNL